MTTIAYNSKAKVFSVPELSASYGHYNKFAMASLCFALLFIAYFFIPHGGALYPILKFSVLFIVIVPALALALSVISLRQIYRTNDRGLVLSYISLAITSLYFMVALAIPLVLIGLYLLYSFVV